MAFGPIMRLRAGEYDIELSPLSKDDLTAFVSPGLQQGSVTKYLSRRTAPTLEDELEWYDKTRTDQTNLVWGIKVIGGNKAKRKVKTIGTSGLDDIELEPLRQATSGVMIADKSYWNKGITSRIHMARTWFAFRQLGLVRIKSGVYFGNDYSLRALERSGYIPVYIERNATFVDGTLRHMHNLECLNPDEWAWRQWWGRDRPTKAAREARKVTLDAMDWAEKNVELL